MKRIIALVLVLLMLLPMMFACKKDDESKETNGTTEGSEELPVIVEDLGGKVFNVLTSADTANEYAYKKLVVEDMNGSVLDQAIYVRNISVFTRLNATMTIDDTPVNQSEMLELVRTAYYSGELVYDFVYGWSPAMTTAALEGMFASVDKVSDVIDLSDEWWEPSVVESTAINGQSYGIVGQADTHFYESIYLMAYNIDRAKELDIPSLGELALDGGWTLEVLNGYAKIGYTDDGPQGSNSIKDGYDRFGFTTNQYFISTVLIGAGETILNFDKESNYPTFDGFSDRLLSIYSFVRDNFYNSNYSFIHQNDIQLLESGASFHDLFTSGNTLFYAEPIGSLAKLKNAEFEYGVLPSPKWDADDEYISPIGQYAMMFYIPAGTTDFRPVSIFLDNLNYQSMVDVTKTYMEDVVSLQRLQNHVSYQVMQDIILKTDKYVSLVIMYNWGNVNTDIQKYALNNKGIASLGASLRRTLPGAIEKSLGPKK